jgi:protein-S-isoprenylcysteine O-methyltransferase Ste14
MKRPLPPTLLLAALAAMVTLHLLLPAGEVLAFPWTLAGTVPLAAGVSLALLADQALKRHGTTVKPCEESSALVTDGVFWVSRNPMYMGFTLLLLGFAVLLGSAAPLVVVPAFAAVMDIVFIQVEERMLHQRFGAAWVKYASRVRRWI